MEQKNELEKVPTNELINSMTELDRQIDLMIYRYNKVRDELVRRFPPLGNEKEFKPKELIKK